MALIREKVRHRQLDKGEYLYQAGEQTNNLFVLHSGMVRVFRLVESGKEQLVRILQAGDFMGEWSLFNAGHVHENYAQAMRSTSICMIQHEDMQEFLKEYPEISLKLLGEMSRRLDQSEKQATQLSTEQVGTRLAFFIADQVQGDQDQDIELELPISRKDIASYLGTTPETISRKFKDLEKQGLIQQISSKKIKIPIVDDLLLYSE
ncbi:Crp/Fnr family transcriptional regulator [Facklamia sp. DSM 111018]|uniref:Crp/Fnr family transcriptional regulator n=2 Tax=Facklamia lactis TaxID=2749967 RepID=A0ABS0LS86_9LACT|nr:Crp/Fnr family transcriptional regulator [Facklamia lactis]MBG9987028.1 Crp/Fnr family transcriptional regulator [Facklamia lactis]